jgi:hypothetical protein
VLWITIFPPVTINNDTKKGAQAPFLSPQS